MERLAPSRPLAAARFQGLNDRANVAGHGSAFQAVGMNGPVNGSASCSLALALLNGELDSLLRQVGPSSAREPPGTGQSRSEVFTLTIGQLEAAGVTHNDLLRLLGLGYLFPIGKLHGQGK